MPEELVLEPAEEQQLAKDDPELLKEMRRKRERIMKLQYPPKTVADVKQKFETLKKVWGAHHAQMAVQRSVRYMHDMTPEKWAVKLEDNRRVRTRLSHNEVLRVGANQARNRFKVRQRPAGKSPSAQKRARKQERWQQEFWPAMERASALPLRRRWVDAQNGDSMGVYEVYLTGAYEDLDLKQGPDEDDDTYLERTDEEILALGECAAIGVRYLDPLSVWPELVDGGRRMKGQANPGVSCVVIAEKKNYRDVCADLVKRRGVDKFDELQMPRAEDKGWPLEYGASWGVGSIEDVDGGVSAPNDATGDVEHIRYYDGYWYIEIVGGKEVVNEPHGMPGVPAFLGWCHVTGSSNYSEAIEGVTWGMLDLELAANDLLTHKVDTTITFGRPAPAVETAVGGTVMKDSRTKQPVELDLSDPSRVKQLAEGQRIVDAYAGFRGRFDTNDIAEIMSIWERNGLNPIASGESPGASAAGYTVNSLMGASLAAYEESIENEERTAAAVLDFVRLLIRDTIKEKCWLSVPMEDEDASDGTEWLALGPEDIDETPVQVMVDPQSEANRMAKQNALLAAMSAKVISRKRVMREGWDIEDTDAEDLEIIDDDLSARLIPVLLENVVQRVQLEPPKPAPTILGPDGKPISSARMDEQAKQNGQMPADPNPPTVGAEASAATQSFTTRARGGQGNGYAPPPGPLNRGEG